ncbi:excalibur calcium-binding domain-containing protein [Basilea psittacipulmonis]|nr:excalibur calcium-binding domain-containing protein [Basilea psittacipulmonis]
MLSPSAQARNAYCSDFNTQAEAQAFMRKYNAYYLDRDRDGEACECLPGGSQHGKRVCQSNTRTQKSTH